MPRFTPEYWWASAWAVQASRQLFLGANQDCASRSDTQRGGSWPAEQGPSCLADAQQKQHSSRADANAQLKSLPSPSTHQKGGLAAIENTARGAWCKSSSGSGFLSWAAAYATEDGTAKPRRRYKQRRAGWFQGWDAGSPWARAVHESGHAVVAWFVSPTSIVKKVDIVGAAHPSSYEYMIGGMTHIHLFPANPLDVQGWIRDHICILLGGMAGERVLRGRASAGGLDDLHRASVLAEAHVAVSLQYQLMAAEQWLLENVVRTEWAKARAKVLADRMDETMRSEVVDVLGTECARSLQLLRRHADLHKALSNELYHEQEMNGGEIRQVLGEKPLFELPHIQPAGWAVIAAAALAMMVSPQARKAAKLLLYCWLLVSCEQDAILTYKLLQAGLLPWAASLA